MSSREEVNCDLCFEMPATAGQGTAGLIRDDILVSTISYNGSFTHATRYKQSLRVLQLQMLRKYFLIGTTDQKE